MERALISSKRFFNCFSLNSRVSVLCALSCPKRNQAAILLWLIFFPLWHCCWTPISAFSSSSWSSCTRSTLRSFVLLSLELARSATVPFLYAADKFESWTRLKDTVPKKDSKAETMSEKELFFHWIAGSTPILVSSLKVSLNSGNNSISFSRWLSASILAVAMEAGATR